MSTTSGAWHRSAVEKRGLQQLQLSCPCMAATLCTPCVQSRRTPRWPAAAPWRVNPCRQLRPRLSCWLRQPTLCSRATPRIPPWPLCHSPAAAPATSFTSRKARACLTNPPWPFPPKPPRKLRERHRATHAMPSKYLTTCTFPLTRTTSSCIANPDPSHPPTPALPSRPYCTPHPIPPHPSPPPLLPPITRDPPIPQKCLTPGSSRGGSWSRGRAPWC